MPIPIASAPLFGDVSADVLLRTLLDVSLTAVNLVRPVYAPASATLVDFALEYLNPAAQRITGLAERPGGTMLEHFPHAQATGIFAYYQRAFETGEQVAYETNYQADGLDNYFRFCAQRTGEYLLISFTDTNDQDRSAVEQALRDTQAQEQAARAEAEVQRQRFYDLLMQLPAQVAVHEGPDQVFTLVNPGYQRMAPGRVLQGQPIRESWPELVSQGILDVLDQVYHTGEPFVGKEVPLQVDITRTGQLKQLYVNAFFLPLRDAQGQVRGVLDFSYDMTEQVLARQQVEQLNQELETRMQARAQEALALQAELLEAARHQGQERENVYQLFEQAPAAICLLREPDHRISYLNPAYQALFPGHALQGRTLAEAQPDNPALVTLFDKIYQEGQTQFQAEVPVSIPPPAGQPPRTRYFDFTYQAYREQGRIAGISLFGSDVTERVENRRRVDILQTELLAQAQQQVMEREVYYQVFAQTAAAVGVMRGPTHRFEYVNAPYQAFFAPGQQLVGLSIREVAPEAEAQGFVALLDHVYQTGETYMAAETPFVFAEAVPRTAYINFTYQAYYELGQVVGVSVFAFDVTEQVRVRQQQQVQAQRLRDVFTQAPVAIFVVRGQDYVFDVVNASMGQMLNMAPGYMLGKGYFELLPGLEAQGYRQLLDQVWHTGQEYVAQEQAAQLPHHQPGEKGYYNFTYVPLREADGSVVGILCVAVDVTAQVLSRQQVQALNEQLTATNSELKQSNTQLTRTNVDLDTFVYTASHDLKAPITNIEGLLHALQHHLPADVQAEETTSQLLGMMQGAVERFQFTINQLTDVSRLQQAQDQPAEQVPLLPVIKDVLLDLRPLLLSTRARLTVDVGTEVQVLISPKSLRSVVVNLISNALKYHQLGQPPVVLLRATILDGHAAFTVQDEGLGMNTRQLERLFGLFQRLHVHVEGTGVGLYMVKRLIENAGGTITVQSQEGVGSTFTVTLPTGQTP